VGKWNFPLPRRNFALGHLSGFSGNSTTSMDADLGREKPAGATLLHGSASGRSDPGPSWSHAMRT
jgi:hypothetical protein